MAKSNTKIVKKKSRGRPSKATPDVLDKFRVAFLMGCNDQEACIHAGVCPDILYDYQKKNPKYVEQKEAWKKNPTLKSKMTVYNNLDKVDVAQWYLERKAKDEFSTKTITETTSPDDAKKLDTLARIIITLSANVKREFKKQNQKTT